jgi:hypothetical protein
VIGWQAELALCDWLVESHDPIEGTRVFPLPSSFVPTSVKPGSGWRKDSLQRASEEREGGGKEEELQPLLV